MATVMNTLNVIQLKGVTSKGKTRVETHGEFWEVVNCTWLKPKPSRLFVRSIKTGECRWLTEDFKIVG